MKKFKFKFLKLKCKLNPESGEPFDELTEECVNYLQSINSSSRCVSDIIDNKDPKVYKVIEEGELRFKKNLFFNFFLLISRYEKC